MRNNFGLGFIFEAVDRFSGPASRVSSSYDRMTRASRQAGAGAGVLGQQLNRLRDAQGKFVPRGLANPAQGPLGGGRDTRGRFLPKGAREGLSEVADGLADIGRKGGFARLALTAVGTAVGHLISSAVIGGFRSLRSSIGGVAQGAIDFESAMADVNKVLPKGMELQPLADGAKRLAKEIGLAPTQVAALTASLAQSGIAGEELIQTAEDASKLAVAFGISGEESGQALAKLRTGLGLSRDEVNSLTGSINELSNNLAATAPEIVDAVQRVGSVAKAANVSETTTAALATAMIASGAGAEVAATGTKNFLRALGAGEAVTKRQKKAFEALGLDSVEVAKQLTSGGEAAEKTILDVVTRIGELEQHKRLPNLIRLFGAESIGAIGPLATNIKLLGQSFDIAGNKANSANSVQKEYETRSKTTAVAIERLKANVSVLAIELGTKFLPLIQRGIGRLNAFVEMARRGGTRLWDLGERVAAFASKFLAPVRLLYQGLVQAFSQGGFSGAVRAELNRAHNAGIKRFVINVYALFHRLKVFFEGVADGFAKGWKRVGPIVESIFNSLKSVAVAFLNLFFDMSENATNTSMSSWRDWGSTLGESFATVLEHVATALDWFAKLIENNEWLVQTALWGYVAFKAFAAGIWLANAAGKVGRAVAWGHTIGLKALRVASIGAAFGMKVLRAGLAMATTGFKALRAAVLANPVLAVVSGLAYGAVLVYEYWEPISDFFGGLWEHVTELSKAALDWIVSKIEWVGDKLRQFKDIVTFTDTYDSGRANEQRSQLMGLSTEQLTGLAGGGGPLADQARDALKLRRQGESAIGTGARTYDALSVARSRAEGARSSVVAAQEGQKDARYAAQGDQWRTDFRAMMEQMEMANANAATGGQNMSVSLLVDGEKLAATVVKQNKSAKARGFAPVDARDEDE